MGLPALLMLVAVALSIYEWVTFLPEMPPFMASTFDFGGAPSGWMRREVFFTVMATVYLFWIGFFAGFPLLLGRLPAELWNLPHRDHWLAPERRGETVEYFASWIAWVGAGGLLFLAWVSHLVIEANRTTPAELGDSFVWLLTAGMGALAWWLWRLYRRFRLPDRASALGRPR